MARNLGRKLWESFIAVIPITAIVLIINFSAGVLDTFNMWAFVVGAVMLILGMALYTLGSSISMEPMGEQIGAKTMATKKPLLILAIFFVIGIVVTIAEPDLSILASQISSIPNMVLIAVVGVGVGLLVMFAVLRLFLKIPFNYLLIGLYAVVFIIAIFVSENYVPLAFDSGGVTTGPIVVPFILALGVGISSAVGGKSSQEDSFGFVALSAIGPIIAVLILGLVYKSEAEAAIEPVSAFASFGEVMGSFGQALPYYLKEVAIALAPILAFFLIYQFTMLKLPVKALGKMFIGLLYTYIGLTLFLTGVNVGFMPAGTAIGMTLAGISKWILIPIGAVVGAFIVLAEPAVHVLKKQVESITGGTIKSNTLLIVLCIAIGIAVGLSMLRVATGISIWWIIAPGYVISLGLSFFVPKMFTAIAFDSGGVASGPMTATFVLPFAMGSAYALGGNILTDAFGIIATVTVTPIIAIQILGLVYKLKSDKATKVDIKEFADMLEREGDIIQLI